MGEALTKPAQHREADRLVDAHHVEKAVARDRDRRHVGARPRRDRARLVADDAGLAEEIAAGDDGEPDRAFLDRAQDLDFAGQDEEHRVRRVAFPVDIRAPLERDFLHRGAPRFGGATVKPDAAELSWAISLLMMRRAATAPASALIS